jgi:hypothetical protein
VKAAESQADTYDHGRISNHATRRTQQRGVRDADLLLLLFGADREAPVGEGCVALSISRKCRKELLAEGYPQAPSIAPQGSLRSKARMVRL